MEKYRSGLGYKKISETLNIPLNTIKSIIKEWKEYGTTTILPREGRHPKLTDQARRALIREATKIPKITLNQIHVVDVDNKELEALNLLHYSPVNENGGVLSSPFLDYVEGKVVVGQVSDLLPICGLVIVDQAYHRCVIGKLKLWCWSRAWPCSHV